MSDNLKTIYIFTDWYYPAYKAGGPIQSVYNLAGLLSGSFQIRVITRNNDYGSAEPLSGVAADEWNTLAPGHEVLYLSPQKVNIAQVRSICKSAKHDIVLINGIFSFYFSILPAFFSYYYNIKSSFVAVRGMLHQSALSVKPMKKQLYLAFARGFGLYRKATLLSTSEYENNEIKRSFGSVKIAYAPNIPVHPVGSAIAEKKQFRDDKGALRLLFLGRISPEKNPVALIKALSSVKYPVSVIFVGSSIDSVYQSLFENELKKLPEIVHYEWKRELPHPEIQKLFLHTDIMVLPSMGENFGHAIFESLANATPVIIGNNTPWKNLRSQQAGIEVNPVGFDEILKAVDLFNRMSPDEYQNWRVGSYRVAEQYFETNNFEHLYQTLFA